MAVNTTQTKYFQNIGPGADPLSFSTMATTLGLDGSRNVRFGTYKRNTGANEVFADVNGTSDEKAAATAVVPDSYENQRCGVDGTGISVSTNLKMSSLKNMIKRYDVSYTGGSTSQANVSGGGGIIGDTWANNLDLNVPKRLAFDGSTWRASSTSTHAVYFSGAALNLEMKFNGSKILGKEGVGGAGQPGGGNGGENGKTGGGALYLRNTTSKTSSTPSTIYLNLSNTSLIAGGGGGGAGGGYGSVNGTTTCTNTYTRYTVYNWDWWSGCPAGCNAGETRNACRVGSQANNYNYSVTYFRGQRAQGTWYYTPWETQCSGGESNNIGSASRRGGGVGGSGQGSNNTGGPVGGNSGQSAYSLNCPAGTNAQNTTSTANAGQTGATGGIYGARGGDSNCCLGGSGGPWLNVSNTRWANKGASGAIVQKVNIA